MAIAMAFLSLYWLSFSFSSSLRTPMNSFPNMNFDCTCWSQLATSASVDVNGIFHNRSGPEWDPTLFGNIAILWPHCCREGIWSGRNKAPVRVLDFLYNVYVMACMKIANMTLYPVCLRFLPHATSNLIESKKSTVLHLESRHGT